MLYQVHDDFLPLDEFEYLVDHSIHDPMFIWRLSHGKVPKQVNDQETKDRVKKVDFQFVHSFFDDSQWYSDRSQLIVPIMEKLQHLAIIRIKMNLTMPSDKIESYGFHTDVHPDRHRDRDFMTGVYYLNDNDGGTMFEDGSKVESVANRMVMFHGSTKHAATTFTNAPYRAVLNLNWV